jgi:hypothetical protein
MGLETVFDLRQQSGFARWAPIGVDVRSEEWKVSGSLAATDEPSK